MSIDAVSKNAKLAKLGEGKGLMFSFHEGEILHFPKVEECWPFFKEFNGTDIMYVGAYFERANRFVEVPVSAFRRIPNGEGEVEAFYNDELRPLNVELASLSTDLQRLIRLCEIGTIKCSEIFEAHRAVFETDSEGKPHRVEGKFRPLKLPVLEAVKVSE